MKRSAIFLVLVILLAITASSVAAAAASPKYQFLPVVTSGTNSFTAPVKVTGKMIGVNILSNTPLTDEILKDLGLHGTIREVLYELNAVTMQARESELPAIRAESYVAAANPDAERKTAPVSSLSVTDFSNGVSTWDLDAVNVTDFGLGRVEAYDGSGVYVAVLDTGLVNDWRFYFPQERIAVEYAKSFGGGGGNHDNTSEQPNKWEQDQNSHGTHVASTILGYYFAPANLAINGVAPMATVIPVKVLNQNGSGWSSVIARGITYVADLKLGPLAAYPVVINMSLGGSMLDAMEQAAIDYAVAAGVIIVASAGNQGTAGMGYPGAYQPVISVAASGWVGQWTAASWWRNLDVADPTSAGDFYITDFSSRQLDGQDLDVAAPGSWIVGPYQPNSGQISYYYLSGTSMASPHVAGIVALMAQKDPALNALQAENTLVGSALPLPPGCRQVNDGSGSLVDVCWGADASGAGLATADAALAALP